MSFTLQKGQALGRDRMLALVELAFRRTDFDFHRGTFRVRGDTVEILPAHQDKAIRLEFWGDELEQPSPSTRCVARSSTSLIPSPSTRRAIM